MAKKKVYRVSNPNPSGATVPNILYGVGRGIRAGWRMATQTDQEISENEKKDKEYYVSAETGEPVAYDPALHEIDEDYDASYLYNGQSGSHYTLGREAPTLTDMYDDAGFPELDESGNIKQTYVAGRSRGHYGDSLTDNSNIDSSRSGLLMAAQALKLANATGPLSVTKSGKLLAREKAQAEAARVAEAAKNQAEQERAIKVGEDAAQYYLHQFPEMDTDVIERRDATPSLKLPQGMSLSDLDARNLNTGPTGYDAPKAPWSPRKESGGWSDGTFKDLPNNLIDFQPYRPETDRNYSIENMPYMTSVNGMNGYALMSSGQNTGTNNQNGSIWQPKKDPTASFPSFFPQAAGNAASPAVAQKAPQQPRQEMPWEGKQRAALAATNANQLSQSQYFNSRGVPTAAQWDAHINSSLADPNSSVNQGLANMRAQIDAQKKSMMLQNGENADQWNQRMVNSGKMRPENAGVPDMGDTGDAQETYDYYKNNAEQMFGGVNQSILGHFKSQADLASREAEYQKSNKLVAASIRSDAERAAQTRAMRTTIRGSKTGYYDRAAYNARPIY